MDEILKYAIENGIELSIQIEDEVIKLSILHMAKDGTLRVARTASIYRDEYSSLEKYFYYAKDALDTLVEDEKKYKNLYNGTQPTLKEILNSMRVDMEEDRL